MQNQKKDSRKKYSYFFTNGRKYIIFLTNKFKTEPAYSSARFLKMEIRCRIKGDSSFAEITDFVPFSFAFEFLSKLYLKFDSEVKKILTQQFAFLFSSEKVIDANKISLIKQFFYP